MNESRPAMYGICILYADRGYSVVMSSYDKLIYDNLVYIKAGDAEQTIHYRIFSLSIFLRLNYIHCRLK